MRWLEALAPASGTPEPAVYGEGTEEGMSLEVSEVDVDPRTLACNALTEYLSA